MFYDEQTKQKSISIFTIAWWSTNNEKLEIIYRKYHYLPYQTTNYWKFKNIYVLAIESKNVFLNIK